jgi:beta-galactosidase beta subunit
MKLKLRGKRFKNIYEIEQNLQQVLNEIRQEEFQTYFNVSRIAGIGVFLNTQKAFFEGNKMQYLAI